MALLPNYVTAYNVSFPNIKSLLLSMASHEPFIQSMLGVLQGSAPVPFFLFFVPIYGYTDDREENYSNNLNWIHLVIFDRLLLLRNLVFFSAHEHFSSHQTCIWNPPRYRISIQCLQSSVTHNPLDQWFHPKESNP